MGKFIDITGRLGRWIISGVNPGFKAKYTDEPIPLDGVTLHRCPNCKRPLAETNGTTIRVHCRHCRRWVLLEKA